MRISLWLKVRWWKEIGLSRSRSVPSPSLASRMTFLNGAWGFWLKVLALAMASSSVAERSAGILLPKALLEEKAKIPGHGSVYAPYVLYRTWEVLSGVSVIDMNTQVRPLIEAVYKDRVESSELLQGLYRDLEAKRSEQGRWALVAADVWNQVTVKEEDSFARTRLGGHQYKVSLFPPDLLKSRWDLVVAFSRAVSIPDWRLPKDLRARLKDEGWYVEGGCVDLHARLESDGRIVLLHQSKTEEEPLDLVYSSVLGVHSPA